MIQPQDRRLGTREFLSVVILTIGIKFSDMTPTILFKELGNVAWMTPIISGIIMMVPFVFMLLLLKHYKNLGFIDIMRKVVGNKLTFLFGMTMFFISFSSTVVNSRSYTDIINTMFFPNTSTIQILILLLGASWFVANRGFLVIGYTSYLTAPYIKLIFLLMIILVIPQLNVTYLFPLFGKGADKLTMESLDYSPIFADILYFAVIFPYIKNYKSFQKASLLGFGFVIVEIAIFLAVYVMFYDYTGLEHIPYPFQEITRALKIGRTLSNVEALFLGFWSVASIIRFAVYLYISVAIFSYSLKVKEFEPLLLPFAALAVLLASLPENMIKNTFVYREDYLLNMTWAFFLALPPLIWIIAKIRGEFSK